MKLSQFAVHDMTNIVPLRTGALTRGDARKLDLFRKTVGKDLVGAEIDEAIEYCEIFGANPFVRDIYFFVFDADKPSRNVVPVLGIGLYRKIAARTGNYRPDEQPPRFRYDDAAKSDTNPTGMVDCEVTVNVYQHGEWFPVTERIRWDERAPIKEIWENRQPTGKFRLDAKKKNWHTMPETMMAKCVEAAAIRKAFPNETAGSYIAEELDAPQVIEGTAVEIAEAYASEERRKMLGGPSILVDWCDGEPLQSVPAGQFGDRVLAFIRQHSEDAPEKIALFADRNRVGLREYWAADKDGALSIKKALETYQRVAAREAAE